MRSIPRAVLLSCVLTLSACCGTPPAATCLYGGQAYASGDSFSSTDSCNTCSCTAGGAVVCTQRACAADGGAGDVVLCTGAMPSFPTFDRTCASAADCIIGTHQTNCCGATRAIGMNAAQQARFAADEKVCEAQYPGCGCAASPTVAEDGQTPGAGQSIVVTCQSTQCLTQVR